MLERSENRSAGLVGGGEIVSRINVEGYMYDDDDSLDDVETYKYGEQGVCASQCVCGRAAAGERETTRERKTCQKKKSKKKRKPRRGQVIKDIGYTQKKKDEGRI